MNEFLMFDDSTHTYTLNDRRLISVTQALAVLDDRPKVDPFYLERGRMLHLATEYYDGGILDENTLDERIRGYFNAYLKFKQDTGFRTLQVEIMLHHPLYFYAGRIDRVGDLNGHMVSPDLKSGAKARVDELQGAAYWELLRVNQIPVEKMFDLYLHEDGTYKLEPIEKPKLLLPTFLAALKITQWKEKL